MVVHGFRTFLGFGLVKVRGHSMKPTIGDGDYVLVRTFNSKRRPERGDAIVFRQKSGQVMVKRIIALLPDGSFNVRGDGALSAPTEDLGPIPPEALWGKVVHIIRAHTHA